MYRMFDMDAQLTFKNVLWRFFDYNIMPNWMIVPHKTVFKESLYKFKNDSAILDCLN